MTKFLSRDAILNTPALAMTEVAVPEWQGSVYVRAMTGMERDAFEASLIEGSGKKQKVSLFNLRAKLVAQTACDEAGALLFTAADVEALGKQSAVALQRVFDVARRLSGMSDEDVEELSKN